MKRYTTRYILSTFLVAAAIPVCSKTTVEHQKEVDKNGRVTGKGAADNDCPDCKWAIDGLALTVSLPLDNGIDVPLVGDLQVYAVVDDIRTVSIPISAEQWSCNRRCRAEFTLGEGLLEQGETKPVALDSMSSAEVESLAADIAAMSQLSILTQGSGRPFGLKKVDLL